MCVCIMISPHAGPGPNPLQPCRGKTLPYVQGYVLGIEQSLSSLFNSVIRSEVGVCWQGAGWGWGACGADSLRSAKRDAVVFRCLSEPPALTLRSSN